MLEENTGVNDVPSPSAVGGEGEASSPEIDNKQENMIPKERFDEVNTQKNTLQTAVNEKQAIIDQVSKLAAQNPEIAKQFFNPGTVQPKPAVTEAEIDFDGLDANQKIFHTLSQELKTVNQNIQRISQNQRKMGQAMLAKDGVTLDETFDEVFDKLGYDEKVMGIADYNERKQYYRDNYQANMGKIVFSKQIPTKKDVTNAVNNYHKGFVKAVKAEEKARTAALKADAEKRGSNAFMKMPAGESHLQGDQEVKPTTKDEVWEQHRQRAAAVMNETPQK